MKADIASQSLLKPAAVLGTVAMMIVVQGCTLVGRWERDNTVRYGLLPMYDHSNAPVILSIYDGNIPHEAVMPLQLWSHPVRQPAMPQAVASDQP